MTDNSVLVPLDGSANAEKALRAADTFLQSKPDGCLTIMRALETSRLLAWLPTEMYSREEEVVREYLDEKKKEWQGRGYEVRTVLAPGPGPVDAVLEECSEGRARLVILTSHGASGRMDFLLGSNTEKILRRCSAQILVIKSLEDDVQAAAPPKKILIPLDGSERAQMAILHALDIAPGGTAKIVLAGVSIVFIGHAYEGDTEGGLQSDPNFNRMQGYLESQAEWLINQGYDVDVVVRRGDAAKQLLALATEENIDLIVMTSQGRTGLNRFLFGSVAEIIVRASECSVLVLKAPDSKD